MITLTDVAKAAGVSVATASMVLNPSNGICKVSAGRAERVRDAAQRLGYHGNYHARAMQMGRAETIGLALDFGQPGAEATAKGDMGGVYFHTLTAGVEAQTRFVGQNLAIIGPGHEERATDRGMRQIMQRRIDGLVVAAVLQSIRQTRLYVEQPKLPVVLVEHEPTCAFPVVHYDEAAGIVVAVQHLASLGHRELLWLGPDQEGPRRREQHFIQAVWDAGLKGASCRFTVPTRDGHDQDHLADAAEAGLARHLAGGAKITAVMAYNDSCAIGAYGALMRAGLRIGHDVSVVGFDDIHAPHVFPRLTAVSHMLFEMGRRASELALEMADGGAEEIERRRGHREVFTPRLVVRDSTGPCRTE
jgi:DNA-binding LacI/PurR family transcriptional regulator